MSVHDDLLRRLDLLGLRTPDVPAGELNSATMALSCFPMYMVANADPLAEVDQFRIPFFDLPSIETLREAYAIGREEKYLTFEPEHRRVLSSLLGNVRPYDRVVFEFALETLAVLLEHLEPEAAATVRGGIAKAIVAVANASGHGWFGTGPRVTDAERVCVERIAERLALRTHPEAAAALGELASPE